MIWLLLLLLLIPAGMMACRSDWERSRPANLALVARLEHEMLDGPYQHTNCSTCTEDVRLAALALISRQRKSSAYSQPYYGGVDFPLLASEAGVDWMSVVTGNVYTGTRGEFSAPQYYELRPSLLHPEPFVGVREGAKIKTLTGEDF